MEPRNLAREFERAQADFLTPYTAIAACVAELAHMAATPEAARVRARLAVAQNHIEFPQDWVQQI